MIEIFLTILVFIIATCFSIIAIAFTINAVKDLIEDAFDTSFRELYEREGARKLWVYIKENAEDELHAMDEQYRKYTVDSIYEIYRDGRWKNNE